MLILGRKDEIVFHANFRDSYLYLDFLNDFFPCGVLCDPGFKGIALQSVLNEVELNLVLLAFPVSLGTMSSLPL